jgi:hypothetical protein
MISNLSEVDPALFVALLLSFSEHISDKGLPTHEALEAINATMEDHEIPVTLHVMPDSSSSFYCEPNRNLLPNDSL